MPTSSSKINRIYCHVCGNKDFVVLYKNIVLNRSIFKCRKCGVWILYPSFSDEDCKRIYQSGYFDRWEYKKGDVRILENIKKRLYSDVLTEIRKYAKPKKILDIGCAMGFSLDVIKEKGLTPYGVEISEFAGRIAKEKYKDNVKIGDMERLQFGDVCFDAITMVDMFEHVNAPKMLLVKVWRILKHRGIFAMVIPNTVSISYKIMRKMWPHLNSEHLYYYSPYSIEVILSKTGFKLETIKMFSKPVTLSYLKNVLNFTNPRLGYHILNFACNILPKKMTEILFYLHMGEMLVIARKVEHGKNIEK